MRESQPERVCNLISTLLVNKEHPGLYNNCQKPNKQANNPNLTVPLNFFLPLIIERVSCISHCLFVDELQ